MHIDVSEIPHGVIIVPFVVDICTGRVKHGIVHKINLNEFTVIMFIFFLLRKFCGFRVHPMS